MQNVFESFARRGSGKDAACKLITPQAAVGCNHVGAEGITNFVECRLPGFNELPREDVRVDNCNAPLSKKRGSGGFAHTHAAGET